MTYYLIVCRSLTFAQRTAAALERSGVPAHILRTPAAISPKGCSHSVKIAQRRLTQALVALKRADLTPGQIYLTQGDGSFREVSL